jgi:protein farnesyltransferase/geranylgeranyltransferase type-1 subunit alpha
MDYFWGAMTAGELSERVLQLTEEIILTFNAAHFSVWRWRWRCLEALQRLETEAGAAAEAALMRRVATENPKNYQLWNHRRRWALARGAERALDELEFTSACLAFDAKNYHAWAHRQAVLTAFGSLEDLWDDELDFTSRLLEDDCINNSAWNQRAFVLGKLLKDGGYEGEHPSLKNRIEHEVSFTKNTIRLAPHNAAAWAHLGVLTSGFINRGESEYIREFCIELLKLDPSNVPALEMLAEWYAQRAQRLGICSQADDGQRQQLVVDAAKTLYAKLATANPIRTSYYAWRAEMLTS